MNPTATIRTIVDLADRPRVVRLDDLVADDPAWITQTYYTTPQVAHYLEILRRALGEPAGVGMFLIGPYGSGKSHFLAFVAQNLAAGRLIDDPPHVVSISLLNYPSDITLEQVIGRELDLQVDASGDRRIALCALASKHPRGVCIILDELSEFLRSKREPNAFTEDVRFLQFLGEWSSANRLFVIAGMQEQIEHTGDLDQGLYRKIKDRYPLRFLLTPAHVMELVRDGILKRREGFDAVARRIADDVERSLPDCGLDGQEIAALYPIHPATLALLEQVRDCFSQARGVVDFVVTRLIGDRRRGIDAFLDRPVGDLLTPDTIVDHFRDLLEVQPDHLPLAQQLFPYYDRHLKTLFDRPAQFELANRLIKLLVLDHLAPSGRGVTARQAAGWLLYRASKIDTDKNIAVLARILEKLATEGRHVIRNQDRFQLDFGDSDADVFERRLQREVADCSRMGNAVIDDLSGWLHDRPFNPHVLPLDLVQHRDIRWHFHDRRVRVYFGAGDPGGIAGGLARSGKQSSVQPTVAAPTLVVRPLFSESSHCPGAYALVPRPMQAQTHHFEMLALSRLKGERWGPETARRLRTRIEEKLLAFEQETKNAFAEGQLLDPTGVPIPLPAGETRTFDALIERAAGTMLRRVFPGFERFAPGHGPLPKEAYRRFARLCIDEDLTAESDDNYVDLIREAYLIPMGLLVRRGRRFALAPNLEKLELVRLVLPLIEQRPVPRSVYEYLAQPIYGLVDDQAHLLLLVLLLVGELDLLKDGQSYRELFELVGNPLQYDRIEPVEGLPPEAIADLKLLCEGFARKCPARWNVLEQRRAIEQLRQAGRKIMAELEPMVFRLAEADEDSKLVDRLRSVISPWRTLDSERDPLSAFLLFRNEVESPGRFVERNAEAEKLPKRLDHVLSEVRRHTHLRDALPEVARREHWSKDPGNAPDLFDIDDAEHWVARATEGYREYQSRYLRAHKDYWQEIQQHPMQSYRTPAVARSRHLGLIETIEALDELVKQQRDGQCNGPIDLSFQPTCRCGFDGVTAPMTPLLERAGRLRDAVDQELRLFFGQDKVRESVRGLVADGVEGKGSCGEYLERRAPYPDIQDVPRLDRYLSGIQVVSTLDPDDLLLRLSGRTWQRGAFLTEVARYVDDKVPADAPFRFDKRSDDGTPDDEITRYCLGRCVTRGNALPKGLDPAAVARASDSIRPEDLSSKMLSRIDQMGLPPSVRSHWLRHIADGVVAVPDFCSGESDPITAVRELVAPNPPKDPAALGRIAAAMYRADPVMRRVAEGRWVERLDRIATTKLPDLPELTTLLEGGRELQWLLIDAFGLPLHAALAEDLSDLFGGRNVASTAFARVPPPTTTDSCYRSLIKAGLVRPLVKLDAIDDLLHRRTEPFDILARLAATELRAGWRRVADRFDPGQPILLFADHGFRIDRTGRRFVHGGSSTLERVVPVIRLDP